MDIAKVIGALKSAKQQYAADGLQKPKLEHGASYELGRLAGIQEGLQVALDKITEIADEDDAQDGAL